MSPLDECLACGSGLLHALGWDSVGIDSAWIDLRCAECDARARAVVTLSELQAFERRQAAARRQLVESGDRLAAATTATAAMWIADGLDLPGPASR